MEEITISVTLAERAYRLTINRKEEELIRKAAGEINSRIKQYSENFAFKDKQDLLAMVVLEMTSNSIKFEDESRKNEANWKEELSEINSLLEKQPG